MKSRQVLSVLTIAIALLAMAFPFVPVNAQGGTSPTVIRYDQRFSGEITEENQPVFFVFETEDPDIVTITATPDEPSLKLAVGLYDSTGQEIALNVDSNRINDLTLPDAGKYTIAVISLEGTGGFSLLLHDGDDYLRDGETLLFHETFDSNDVDWETADMQVENGEVLSKFQDSYYLIDFVPPNENSTFWFVAPGFNEFHKAPIFSGDYRYTVELLYLESVSGNYGVGTLFQVQQGYAGFMQFLVNHDGAWFVRRYDSLDSFEDLAEGQLDEAIDLTQGARLSVTVKGNKFTFAVNEIEIDTVVEDSTFTEGTIGFIVATTAETGDKVYAEFDNAVVRAVNGN